jgi:molybdenum cofactor cytidylyltransferase
MIHPSNAAAVITAAGLGTRVGGLKPLLEWRNKPLLQHQIDCLADWGQIIVVIGHDAQTVKENIILPPQARWVYNGAYETGRSGSLAVGFQAIQGSPGAILVVGADQPIGEIVLDALLAAPLPEDGFAVPVCAGKRGHPVLFTGKWLAELRGVGNEPRGLQSLVERSSNKRLEVPVPIPTLDFNTLEIYGAARASELEQLIDRLADYPVYSTRRSMRLFTDRLRKEYAIRPDLILTRPQLFLAGFMLEASQSGWIHLASPSDEMLAQELPQAWRALCARMRAEKPLKVETWLGSRTQGELFSALGFHLVQDLVRYHLDAPESYPPIEGMRPYEERDFEAIMAIHRAGSDKAEQISEPSYRNLLKTVDRTAVLEDAGRLVGYTHLQLLPDMGLFQGLVVDPSAQGKGYGRKLVQDALSYFAGAGATGVELLAITGAIPARRLYESVGFRAVGEQLWMEITLPARAAGPNALNPNASIAL